MESEKKNEIMEEYSFCNCENVEQITPHEADDWGCHCTPPASLFEKCTCFCNVLRASASRITQALKSGSCNLYVQHTNVCHVEVFKKKGDETPIDRFEINSVKGATMRALLVAGALALGAVCLMKCSGNNCKENQECK